MVVQGGLTNSWKRREMKGKGEKKDIPIWMQSSKEQQGQTRKSSSVISAKIEENNRMGKTTDLFKKIGDTKWTFHVKVGTINDRNSMDLTEAKDIRKTWQEYTEELYKKIFMTQITTMVWSLT